MVTDVPIAVMVMVAYTPGIAKKLVWWVSSRKLILWLLGFLITLLAWECRAKGMNLTWQLKAIIMWYFLRKNCDKIIFASTLEMAVSMGFP